MLTFEPDQDVQLVVRFVYNGEPFIPTTGSVKWSVRGNDGELLPDYIDEPVSLGSTDTSTTLTIDEDDNALDPDRRFEKRTVIVRAMANGRPWSQTINYRLCPWLNTTVTNDEVRSYVGVGLDELPDDVIDVWGGYMDVEQVMTKVLLDEALVSGGVNERLANRAIVARAVLNLLPSLRQRLLIRHTDGSIAAQRDKIDLDALRERAQGDLSEAVNAVTGRQAGAYPLLVVATDTDIITGA